MKNFLLATILILGLSSTFTYAQEQELPTEPGEEEVQIEIQQQDGTFPGQESESQEEDLSEDTQESTTLSENLEINQATNFSFLTILLAVLTPALLFVVAYLLIQMANK